MALTTKFLEDLGIEKELQTKIFAEHSKTLEPKLEELKTAQDKIAELSETLKNAPTSETVETLQATIKKYEDAEQERLEVQRKAQEDEVLNTAITSAVGERKFINDFTKDSIYI